MLFFMILSVKGYSACKHIALDIECFLLNAEGFYWLCMISCPFLSDEAAEQNTFEIIRKCPKCGGNDMLTRKTKEGRCALISS